MVAVPHEVRFTRARLRAGAFLLAMAVPAACWPARAEPKVDLVPLPFSVAEFRGPASRVGAVVASTDALRSRKELADKPLVVVWGEGGGAVLALDGDAVRALPLGGGAADLATAERTRDSLPGSRIETAGPLTVSLTEPTPAYPHEALGSRLHARSLTIRERKPVPPGALAQPVPQEVSRVEAGPDAVFEDREPRIVSLGSAGPAVLTVRSRARDGSALVAIARRDGAWRVVAETPPIGEPARWLNPAGIADFLGRGTPQVALVRTPHLTGTLQLWSLDAEPVLLAEAPGYANHVFGRSAQDLAAVIDLDGDGRPELALPTLARDALAVVSFSGGRVREVARIPLPAKAASGVAALGTGKATHLLVGLEDGRVADIRP